MPYTELYRSGVQNGSMAALHIGQSNRSMWFEMADDALGRLDVGSG